MTPSPGRPTRAAAFAESAIARLDERADRVTLALLHERLGRYRRTAGDPEARSWPTAGRVR